MSLRAIFTTCLFFMTLINALRAQENTATDSTQRPSQGLVMAPSTPENKLNELSADLAQIRVIQYMAGHELKKSAKYKRASRITAIGGIVLGTAAILTTGNVGLGRFIYGGCALISWIQVGKSNQKLRNASKIFINQADNNTYSSNFIGTYSIDSIVFKKAIFDDQGVAKDSSFSLITNPYNDYVEMIYQESNKVLFAGEVTGSQFKYDAQIIIDRKGESIGIEACDICPNNPSADTYFKGYQKVILHDRKKLFFERAYTLQGKKYFSRVYLTKKLERPIH